MNTQIYEWVFTLTSGDAVILTENQYQFYKNNVELDDMRQVFFDDCGFNPSYVVSAFRRPAQVIKVKYKCGKCIGNGILVYEKKDSKGKYPTCPVCNGTGMDFNKFKTK